MCSSMKRRMNYAQHIEVHFLHNSCAPGWRDEVLQKQFMIQRATQMFKKQTWVQKATFLLLSKASVLRFELQW